RAQQRSRTPTRPPTLPCATPTSFPGGGLSMLLFPRRSLPGGFEAGQGAAGLGTQLDPLDERRTLGIVDEQPEGLPDPAPRLGDRSSLGPAPPNLNDGGHPPTPFVALVAGGVCSRRRCNH